MRFAIIDTNNLAHRYSVLKLTNPQGEKVGILFGLIRTLRKIVITDRADYLVCFFDFCPPNYYEDEEKIDFYRQLFDFRRFLDMARINHVLAEEGIPADYYIATLVNWLKNNTNFQIMIYSNDHDFLQLVDDRTVVVQSSGKEKIYNKDKVIEKYGFPPEQLVDFWALMGDKADRLKGVEGVGPKRAKDLLEKYGDFLGVITELSTQRGYREKIAEAWDSYTKIDLRGRDVAYQDKYLSGCRHLREGDYDEEGVKRYFVQKGLTLFANLLARGRFWGEKEGEWEEIVE